LIIDYEGRSYEFDSDDLTVKQALKIEKHIGGPMLDWEKGMATGRADCYQALGWLIFHGGDQTPIAEVDFKFGKLAKAFEAAAAKEAEAEKAAEAAKAGPDPTVAGASNGRTPALVSSPAA
jgi:hypothetical protein